MPFGFSLVQTATQSASAASTITTVSATPTLGNIIFGVCAWWNTTGTNSGDVTSISDTQTNTWHRIGATVYSTDAVAGSVGLAIFYAISRNSTATQITFNLSGGPYTHVGAAYAEYQNPISPYLDAESAAKTGNGTTASANTVTTTYFNDTLLLIGAYNNATAPTAIVAPYVFDLNPASVYIWIARQQVVAPGTWPYSQNTLPNSDWVTTLVGMESSLVAGGLASGDAMEASEGYFTPYQELFFQGSMFLDGYTGLPWLKNVFMMNRDFWDTALSTPYSGQLFPTGGNQGGPGQVYPY